MDTAASLLGAGTAGSAVGRGGGKKVAGPEAVLGMLKSLTGGTGVVERGEAQFKSQSFQEITYHSKLGKMLAFLPLSFLI